MITALRRVSGRQGCFSLLAINYDRVDFDAGRQEALVAYRERILRQELRVRVTG